MKSIRKHAATVAAVVALGAGFAPLSSAVADEAPTAEPCAVQQTQVDRAEEMLARLQARLASRSADVREARVDLRTADTARERRSAKADLAVAKAKKVRSARVSKAQVQRVTKAQERLDLCLASIPETPADPTA